MRTALGVFAIGFTLAGCGAADAGGLLGGDNHGQGAGSDAGGGGGGEGAADGGGVALPDGGPVGAGDGGAGGRDAAPPEPSAKPLAKGLVVSEVAVFQSVKVSVAKSGAKNATRVAPVVAKRDALVRVYVTLGAGYTPKAITAELKLSSGGTAFPILTDTKTLSATSTEADLATTFDFSVPGASLPSGVTYSVALTDPTLPGARDAAPSDARYPKDGSLEALDAKSSGDQLKVKLVPFQYNADGSGRLPDTSAAQLENYRKAIYGRYPAAAVDITVRAPHAFSGAIDSSGNGFGAALQELVALRQQDNVADDVYYMGVFAPAADFNTFCGNGCVVGLSGIGNDPSDAAVRASVGEGFTGYEAGLTAAHEIGHAHGRYHAPCGGAAGPDPNFPYAGGGDGAWGYSLNTKGLLDPAQYKDMMGYCTPGWISDYNYNKLFVRMASVNHAPRVVGGWTEPRAYRFLSVKPDGSVAWGQSTLMRQEPRGREHAVTYYAANGAPLATVTGHFYEYGDLAGGFMLVPEAPPAMVRTTIASFPFTSTIARTF